MTLNVLEMTPDQAYNMLLRLAQSKTPHPQYPDRPWRPTVMLHGEPGVGKSSIVRKLSRFLYQKEPIVLNAALIEATDIKGLPDLDRNAGITRWLKPEFLPRSGRGVLFFDEITQARREVMAAMYPVLLDRRVDDWECPDDYLIICAGNDVEDGAIANDMGTALNDRVFHIKIVASVESLINHLKALPHAHPAVLAMLQQHPSYLNMNEERMESGNVASPTPRAWEDVCLALVEGMPDMAVLRREDQASKTDYLFAKAMVAGRVGTAAAEELFATMLDMTECKEVAFMLENHATLKAEDYPKTPRGVRGLCYQIALLVKTQEQARAAISVLLRFREMKTQGINVNEFTAMGIEIIIDTMTRNEWITEAMADKGPFGKALMDYLRQAQARFGAKPA